MLVHFDPEKELTVSCDASPYSIGGVLSHVIEKDSEKVIAFASMTLAKAEEGYSHLDKEGLAIVFAVKRFHQFLYGRPFTVFTDHKPLMSLFSEHKSIPSMASARIQRWALTKSTYQYHRVYRAGKENTNADALSQLPLPDTPASTPLPPETVFQLERLGDSPVSAKQIKIYRSVKGVLQEVHIAHPRVSHMKSLARAYVWWPKMDLDLEHKVQHCKQCQGNQKMPPPVPLQPWEWPNRPCSRLHLDFAGPFMGRMFLVMVDAHTKWLEAHILKNITASVTVDTLGQVFSVHGLPDVVVTNNGSTFTGELFLEFVKQNGLRHICTVPFHPALNGLAERAVQVLKEGLKNMSGASVETKLSRFLFQYRITPQTTTGLVPAECQTLSPSALCFLTLMCPYLVRPVPRH